MAVHWTCSLLFSELLKLLSPPITTLVFINKIKANKLIYDIFHLPMTGRAVLCKDKRFSD